jgi:hypothetical protein
VRFINFSAENKLNLGDKEKMKNDYILYRTKDDYKSDNVSSYIRIVDQALSFEKIAEHIKEIKSSGVVDNEECEILFAIIKNSNSFIFLNAKDIIIQRI